uniref:Green fluorescent protein as(S)FP499 n=2 Tax=Anemonia TaxID=6107 RepID=Q9GPI6_ANESU|nr:green fluorescent protein asFP499 [Anemonia sulcata]AAN52735.1 green fluorescent protein as(s)FP499 [Anemonia sulcata]ABQ58830.1 green fluorescent protein FP499 [Anemonia rustica]
MYPSIKETMRVQLSMEGSVNYHAFKCTGKGEGKPYEGTQSLNITITEGGPLPFAFDILSHAFQYGIKVFAKYPKEIPDFFKQSLPGGFSWERVSTYEDGGVLSATQETSLQGDCIICKVKVLGTNFPANGPVMQKKTCGWEPSTETVIPRDGGLLLRDTPALMLADGGHLSCFMETTYKSKKEVKLPELHFHHLRMEKLNISDDWKTVEQHESVVASYSQVPSKLGHN